MPTALVTGANRGLGLETCRQLARRGHRCVLGVRDPAAGETALRELQGGEHLVLPIDVADPASIDTAVATLRERDLDIDVLVNNAGLLVEGTALEVDLEGIDASWATNTRGPWRLIQLLLPPMLERGHGRVVNVGSGGGSFGEGSMMAGHAAYAVTKAALHALTVVTAAQVHGDVKVNACCPGWVRTRMGGEQAELPVEEGARGIVWLATLDAEGPNGGFFRHGTAIPW